MSAENRVSIKVADADNTAAIESIAKLKTVLSPYLISLTSEERQQLPKMKDKTIGFVTKVIGYIPTNPEFAPPYLNTGELTKDLAAVNELNNYLNPLRQIVAGLDDTVMEAGSEAYVAALSYYNSVKQAAKTNVPNAKTIYEDLKQRFPGRSSKEETTEAAKS
jgi:hypothetical protein